MGKHVKNISSEENIPAPSKIKILKIEENFRKNRHRKLNFVFCHTLK